MEGDWGGGAISQGIQEPYSVHDQGGNGAGGGRRGCRMEGGWTGVGTISQGIQEPYSVHDPGVDSAGGGKRWVQERGRDIGEEVGTGARDGYRGRGGYRSEGGR